MSGTDGVALGFLPGVRLAVDVHDAYGLISADPRTGFSPLAAMRTASYYLGSAAALALVADVVAHRHTVQSRRGQIVVTVRFVAAEPDGAVYALRLDDAGPDEPVVRALALEPEWEAFSIALVPYAHARELAQAGHLAAISDDDGRTLDDAQAVDDLEPEFYGAEDDAPRVVALRARWEFAE